MDQERPESGPRLFDVTPSRRHRALYTRLEVIRVALLVLGAFAVGLTAYTEWLALQPVPYPTVVLPTLNMPRVTPSLAPAIASLSAVPATPGPAGSDTAVNGTRPAATPSLAATPSPSRVRPATPTPSPAAPPPSPTPYPAPTLLEPEDGATPSGPVVFRWGWTAPPLDEKHAFDLRIWSLQEEQTGAGRRGAVAPTRDLRVEVDLTYVPAIRDFGPGDYYWTVVVVEVQAGAPPTVVSIGGESRRFVYR